MPNYRIKPVLQDGYTPEYNFINLNDDNVYEEALNAYNDKTLVSVEDTDGTVFLADTITLDGTNVVLTKGGKTITIANDNTITTSGDIQTTTIEITNDIVEDFTGADATTFEDYIITKELYDKLLSGKYVLKATLYDAVNFIGYPNWVDDSYENVLTNANSLVDTKYLMAYIDTSDIGAMCFLVIGQLTDKRYFLMCDSTAHTIINE